MASRPSVRLLTRFIQNECKNLSLLGVLLLSTNLCFGNNLSSCEPQAFLKNGFKINDYQVCKDHLTPCPSKNHIPDNHCISHMVEQNAVCKQLRALANTLQTSPALIEIKQLKNYFIVDQIFPADGQHSYSIISPAGCLVNTNIDPRLVSKSLKAQYKDTLLLPLNTSMPQLIQLGKFDRFLVELKVMRNCLACAVAGNANVYFDFNLKGKLINTGLINFIKNAKQ